MINGLNYITDEQGKETGIILDLVVLKKHKVLASDVIEALSGLQQLIDQAGSKKDNSNDWDAAKQALRNIKS